MHLGNRLPGRLPADVKEGAGAGRCRWQLECGGQVTREVGTGYGRGGNRGRPEPGGGRAAEQGLSEKKKYSQKAAQGAAQVHSL
ncbi:hypothetical protein kuro4_07730 [Gelria sp. Kuro-4]|nr:hypothetical protein kuro4_07730 [Gelria sp. Kuro-4]